MESLNNKLKPLFKEHLPNNAHITIQQNLLQKGSKYSIQYVRQNVTFCCKKPNNEIINEAVLMCTKIVNSKMDLIEKNKKYKKVAILV